MIGDSLDDDRFGGVLGAPTTIVMRQRRVLHISATTRRGPSFASNVRGFRFT
jgi:hypothetical protein